MRKFMYIFVVGLMLALVMHNHNRSTTETASTLDTMYVSTSLVPTTVSTVAPTTTTEIPATTTTVAPTTTTTAKPKPVTTTVVVAAAPPASSGVNSFLECVKQRESRGDYTAVNASSGSAGAYQFVQNTWNATANHIGRPDLVGLNPAAASPATQDMMAMALYNWQSEAPWYYPSNPC